ncbi:Peptidoglycan/LPS O-acetylase OafA/YrhL, contains acyltransferase and SGNH-hydrolase domains [Mycolicibacterium rutilum]|uniref:Peptidoglycan/LPS O-acetylase OafA/YrhL, contains acyltransferase and SGNH-hydrolase domains n=1 Tax=Mycolicibacterium rutilum TaxID=370526 RepID=A0A1H6IM62_MYCRU|nr:acyltransferase family protein [Mycolicibacterium rutilum]SEH50106.1 Peptidoglycan/LPS O-acetylase OafA/YrhL, contains acyltransferase and SGNH-hydrolase domains [Mycolicibacterium rutilum]
MSSPVSVAPVRPVTRVAQIRGDLDGLRGLAIALVVVYHVWFGRVSGGVDVFLVLSGFFLGGRLLRQAAGDQPDESWPRAIVRIVRRLVPALVIVLAASAVLTVLVQPQTRWEEFADQGLASLFYWQNWYLADTANDYLRAGEAVSPLQHIWSMSVQGQFFVGVLTVAAVLALVVRVVGATRHRRTVLIGTLALATVLSFWYANVAHQLDQSHAYYDTFARAWELLAGMLAAAAISAVRWPGWLRATAAITGLVAILACGVLLDGADEFPGPWALVPVAATVLLIFSGAGQTDRMPAPNRLLAAAPLVTLGTIAYSLYLWHWPLLIFWLAHTDQDRVGLRDGVVIIALSLALAYLTARLVEDPLRVGASSKTRAAHRLPTPPGYGVLALGGLVTVLAVALVVSSLAWRGHVEAVRANGVELQTLSTRDYPGAQALLENTRVAKLPMRPTVLEAGDDLPATTLDQCITDFASVEVLRCVYGDTTASRTIALAGGSHSEHWITALDLLGRTHGFRVVTYLKMGCPLSTDDDPRIAGSEDPYPLCKVWVRAAMDALKADRPDYVFTTTTRPHPNGPGDRVPDSYVGIWDELSANELAILGLRDTPWMFRDGILFSPVDCLSEGGDPESCGLPRSEALADRNPTLEHADRYPLMSVLDVSDAVCRPDVCRAVEGNVLVYHDAHHLSATYVRTLADELGRQLSDATGWW